MITDVDPQNECRCSAPETQSLNNCIQPLPTYFFRLEYWSGERFNSPKKLILRDCEFVHFYYSLGALIQVPLEPAVIEVESTRFHKWSTCGSVFRNTSTVPIGKRAMKDGNKGMKYVSAWAD